MIKADRSNEIIANVFAMDEGQLAKFLSSLSAETLEYLEIVLAKAEKNSSKLKRYLDSR